MAFPKNSVRKQLHFAPGSATIKSAVFAANKHRRKEGPYMNQKEIGELRRRWRLEKNAVGHIYGCFVNSAKQIVTDLDESLGLLPQEEAEKYLSFLQKVLSGTLGRNLIDIVFSNRQVMEGEEHRLLTQLRAGALKDAGTRGAFYQKVIGNLNMGEDSYLLLMACDSYDVPRRGRHGGTGDEVFTYFLCSVCPVKERKPELDYFPGDNEFHAAASRVVCPPELGFLFPAFDDRTANIYNALFYTRRPEELHQDFIDAVFHTEPPMSAPEQREAFQNALSESLDGAYSMEVAQAVHERLGAWLNEHKESRDPEPLAVTAQEVSAILRDCAVPEEQVKAFQDRCSQEFGEGAALNPANLIDTGRFQVKTAQATVSVDPESIYLVEAQVIDGKKYLLIPAQENVEVNGMEVKLRE